MTMREGTPEATTAPDQPAWVRMDAEGNDNDAVAAATWRRDDLVRGG